MAFGHLHFVCGGELQSAAVAACRHARFDPFVATLGPRSSLRSAGCKVPLKTWGCLAKIPSARVASTFLLGQRHAPTS